jgi:NAD-dependent dihydropyrimidine dehydrogenase PreA subunit/biotin operon repressor
MKREIIKIDEEKCNGCGLCIPNCHEGALQIIDGKARLISDLMCDGLGACIGHCPEGAMEIEMREAQPYDEVQVMEEMVGKGKNVVIAHMKHLKDHGEFVFLKQAAGYLMANENSMPFPVKEVIQEVHSYFPGNGHAGNGHADKTSEPVKSHELRGISTVAASSSHSGGGCPGSRSVSFAPVKSPETAVPYTGGSQLNQWPVQMHLINPQAAHFQNSDLLLAADCVAYSVADFHNSFLKGKTLAIACPKLDTNKEIYLDKLIRLVNDARINTLTVIKMEVPCCSGIEQMAVKAVQSAERKVPVKSITVGIRGDILEEAWL